MNKTKKIILWFAVVALSLCAACFALGFIAIPVSTEWNDGHGNIYSGKTVNGQWIGDVHIKYKDGSTFEGTLKNGQWDGTGTFKSADGWEFSGEFAEGVAVKED